MKETHEFLVPEYYPGFACKMGACRHSCCEGWSVTVSLKDYYKLLNGEYAQSLRRRIGDVLRALPRPTPDEYAEIAHDYTGRCRLHMDDGRCLLHAEAGEDALAPLCRLFPRGVRAEGDYECSCALSCEATHECLRAIKAPLRFIRVPLTIDMPELTGRSVYFETVGREQEIRLFFIRIVQDRRHPLRRRLMNLSRAIEEMEDALLAADKTRVGALLSRDFSSEAPDAEATAPSPFALEVAAAFVSLMDEDSEGLREYGGRALTFFREDGNYARARASFEAAFPDWEVYFEHLLVNHMFFSRFPFQDRPDSLRRERSALNAVYILLRFICLGCVRSGETELIDACRAVFHFIDHTSFDRYAGALLEKTAKEQGEAQEDLLKL